MDYFSSLITPSFLELLASSLYYAVFILPFFLAYGMWLAYMEYIQNMYVKNIKWVMLEIKLPREIFKSPRAMEIALGGLYNTSTGSLIDKYIKGRVMVWSSLEICSFGGTIKFFIRTPEINRNMIESYLYAQYPEVEINEAEDYTSQIPYQKDSGWRIFGLEYQLTKPDPYPIKTYVEYELDKDKKEELKSDPIVSFLEFIGSINPNEQIWIQILIKPVGKRYQNKSGEPKGFSDVGKELVDELYKRKEIKDETVKSFSFMLLSGGERKMAESVERNLEKPTYDVGIRSMYIAKTDAFRAPVKVGVINVFRPYASENFNSFKPYNLLENFDYPWQDYKGIREEKKRKRMIVNYCERSYFYPPATATGEHKPFALTTEELATIFHLPGTVAMTPTLERIPSKRSEPPTNLPI